MCWPRWIALLRIPRINRISNVCAHTHTFISHTPLNPVRVRVCACVCQPGGWVSINVAVSDCSVSAGWLVGAAIIVVVVVESDRDFAPVTHQFPVHSFNNTYRNWTKSFGLRFTHRLRDARLCDVIYVLFPLSPHPERSRFSTHRHAQHAHLNPPEHGSALLISILLWPTDVCIYCATLNRPRPPPDINTSRLCIFNPNGNVVPFTPPDKPGDVLR